MLAARSLRRARNQPQELPHGLTARELQVINARHQGLAYKQISAELDISQRTVKKHVSAVLQKLRVQSSAQAIYHLLGRPTILPQPRRAR